MFVRVTSLLLTGAVLGGLTFFSFRPDVPARARPVRADTSRLSPPAENRFTRTVLTEHLDEPMELAVAADGQVLFIDRTGAIRHYDPTRQRVQKINTLPVLTEHGNGLLGITLDPAFTTNRYVYLFYTPKNGPLRQSVSRFTLGRDSLDYASERVLLDIPIDLESSAHTGGSMQFDDRGNLFISVGDNTTPFASDGFAPIDERAGRLVYDAQRSSGNTNDLRGKILKIHPEYAGPVPYTIPDGNLFPKDGTQGRPEIYVMGCRNPYRLSYDSPTQTLYWGEIGPDSGKDGPQGPRGYDEFNGAKKPGNYGWPYFVGDNKAYHAYNFETKQVGPLFDVAAPVNTSVHNTGGRVLPPAQPALIWYPYNESAEFPVLGKGGRSAMAGPVYRYDASLASAVKFPAYYDGALFAFDWMRNWIMAVHLDERGNVKRIEPFMPATRFDKPIDMQFGPEGALYVLEYGENYGVNNPDASLVRIDFHAGNRPPIARISVSDTVGTFPLSVRFSARQTEDFDRDSLTFRWQIAGKPVPNATRELAHTFTRPGIHPVTLTVTDAQGATATARVAVRVGNAPPKVAIRTSGNRTFYRDRQPLDYTVVVTDKEDGRMDPARLVVQKAYLAEGKDVPGILVGHQPIAAKSAGKELMAQSDCKSCHMVDRPTVGPSFQQIAARYAGQPGAVEQLAKKVINGGGGVWGAHAMSAHPQLSTKEAAEMVSYILTLKKEPKAASLPARGRLLLTDHLARNTEGTYVLSATYTDKGGPVVGPLSSRAVLLLRHPTVQAEDYDDRHNIRPFKRENGAVTVMGAADHGSYLVFRQVDLKGIGELTYRLASKFHDATIEVRTDSPTGPVISRLAYRATGDWSKVVELSTPITDPGGLHDLYFVLSKPTAPNSDLINLDWIRFGSRPATAP